MDLLEPKISKISCLKKDTNCNVVRPFSSLELFGKNPFTNFDYTDKERQHKINQFENICQSNNGILGRCCDPKDKNIEKVKNAIKTPYKLIKLENDEYNKKVIKVCPEGKKCPGFRPPNAYEMCKLENASIDYNDTAFDLTPDCVSGKCNDSEISFKISSVDTDDITFLEDEDMVEAIKLDDLESLRLYINNDTNKKNRTLQYGYPGNTLLHEAIYRKSKNCSYFLLENATSELIESKNQDGNTPLQIACLKGEKDLINTLIKFGANIYTVNKYGDTPLHSAIRYGDLEVIRYLVFNGSNVFSKNEKGETPLFLATITSNKNINVVRLLVENGSDLLNINNNNNTMLAELNKQKKELIHQEIETYLIRMLHNRLSNTPKKYNDTIKTFPEFSPFETPKSQDSTENVKITYDESLPQQELYTEKYKVPEKILPKSAQEFVEHFETQENKVMASKNANAMMYVLIFFLLIAVVINNFF